MPLYAIIAGDKLLGYINDNNIGWLDFDYIVYRCVLEPQQGPWDTDTDRIRWLHSSLIQL